MTEHLHPDPDLSDRDRILLVGLADGTLRGRRLARAEARVRELPGGADLLERQRRVRRALRDGPVPQPLRVATAPGRTRLRPLWVPRAAPVAALAALLLGLVLVLGPSERPVVAQAADLAGPPATAPAPATAGSVLRADVDGVAFPDWERDLGWTETGARRDTLDGRTSATVFYEHMGHRIAYTILSGPPADPPEDARIVHRGGLQIALTHDPRHGGHDIAVFERDGRTCVLAGHVERSSTLVELAAWTGGGAMRS